MPTRVLVVAESLDLRRLLVASIANDGHTLNTAPTVDEALRKLRASPVPVVAFFDYRLPDAESALAVLPTIEQGGPELQRHRYVVLTTIPLERKTQALAQRLGVVVVPSPCTLGDLTWEITKQARVLQASEAAKRADEGSAPDGDSGAGA
jgi:DNA-binding NtrC family response regulator